MTTTRIRHVTTTHIRRAPAAAPAKPRPGDVAAVATIAGSVTLLIRVLLHTRSFDLFGDEVIYTDLGRSVISGGFPRFDGGAFFLHGPGFFYLAAGWARLAGNQHDLMAWVYEMRMLNALLAAATAVVLVLLATRASSLRVGCGGRPALLPRPVLHPTERSGLAGDRADALGNAGVPGVHLAHRAAAVAPRLAPRGRRRLAVRLRSADQGRGSPAHRTPVARCGRPPVGAPPRLDLAHG